MKIAVVALGGNALQPANEEWTYEELAKNVNKTILHLKPLFSKYKVVISHGNGPEVGNILLQQHCTKVPVMPLDVCDAMTQGQLGYLLQKSIQNILKKKAVTVVTQIEVDKNDKAFKNPTKPIGPYYKEKIERQMIKQKKGWRKVVASPKPKRIIEIEEIKTLIKKGFVVIACGGGGIPVAKGKGVEAVIDKDYASQLLASQLKADLLIFLTDVDYVYFNYETRKATPIAEIKANELEKTLNSCPEEFGEGSMGPKIEASLEFLKKGKKVIITKPELLGKALIKKAGTVIE
jgi:carbamate kinase